MPMLHTGKTAIKRISLPKDQAEQDMAIEALQKEADQIGGKVEYHLDRDATIIVPASLAAAVGYYIYSAPDGKFYQRDPKSAKITSATAEDYANWIRDARNLVVQNRN